MDTKVLMNTDVALDFLTKNGEKTKEAQMIIRNGLRGRYTLVITSETVSEINYLMLESGMTFSEAKDCLGQLLNLISVIDTNEQDCKEALNWEDTEFDNALTAESARRNKIAAVITRSKTMFDSLDLNLFSPQEFLAIS